MTYGAGAEAPAEIGGVAAEDPEGITLEDGALTLANPAQKSRINNISSGATAVTLDEGVTLELTGATGELAGGSWTGPGTIEVPKNATLRTGECERYKGRKEDRCINGTPTPGYGGLQVKNFGMILGAGISLCRNGAQQPATLENEGEIRIKKSGSFDRTSDCGEAGSVINDGVIGIAALDGSGCNVQLGIGTLVNRNVIKLGPCDEAETEQVQRAKLEIDDSLTEAGTIFTSGIVHIEGDYSPTNSSNLTIDIRQTFPAGSPETNYGTLKISGNATLAGELNIKTVRYDNRPLVLGQKFHILDAGEATGSLSGEFTLGERCVPAQPGYGYNVYYTPGSKGTVTVEVAEVPGC